MALPNFLIVGAAKCGTTSLYRYLSQHPDIFMPKWKELSLFIGDPYGPLHRVKKTHYYYRVFSKVKNETAIGEASTCYLYDKASPNLIIDALGPIKIIIILRNPVDMAYSLYNHELRKEGETIDSFETALRIEGERYSSDLFQKQCYGWHANYYYFNRGLYYDQVRRYFNIFGKQNVKILLFDNLIIDPVKLSQLTYRFLGVDTNFLPEIKIHNRRGPLVTIPKFWRDYGLFQKTLSFALSKNLLRKAKLLIQKRRLGRSDPINITTAQLLSKRFLNDICRLESLIQKDLSA